MSEASHKRSIVVWDLPPAIVCGRTFAIKLGIKCARLCRPENWSLELRDHEGGGIATVAAGDTAWPGTEALYGAALELRAPDCEGLYRFEAIAPMLEHAGAAADRDRVVHEEAVAAFNVRVVREAECRLTVIAIERGSQAPVSGAKVVVHPYRTLTDEHGMAELDLPRGCYRLFVTGRELFPLRLDGELTADTTIRVELEPERGPSDAELWS